jgi:polar amino acid transport system substrate-binding protein
VRRLVLRLVGLGLALGLASVPFAESALAQSGSPLLSRIVKSGELRVGMSGDQPPLNFKSKSGEMVGLEVDLAKAIAGAMGVQLKIVQRPFGELLAALEKGDVDLVMSGMTITPERNMQFAFVGPYYVSGKSILTKSSTLSKAKQASDLDKPGVAFAALAGSTSQHFVEVVLPKAKLVPTKDYDEAVQLLLKDKVQALVADQEICVVTGMRHPKAGLAALARPLTIEPIGIAVAPGDPLFVNFLENTLAALRAAEALDALHARWIENSEWLSQLP